MESATSNHLNTRLLKLQNRIQWACAESDRRSEDIRLLAVSKTRPAEDIHALHTLGVKAFGENYLSEAEGKLQQLADHAIEWHFIGPIQSNKTAAIAQHFSWVQSVDREKIIRRLAEQRPPEQPPLNVLIQVNMDGEAQKSGCKPAVIATLAEQIAAQPRLKLRGLMAIPSADADRAAAAFARMRDQYTVLKKAYDTVDTLSIGMSGDLEAAIAAGSTMLRIGSALFGPRLTTFRSRT